MLNPPLHATDTLSIGLGTAMTLGAIQGVTEFLPVSSSGHIAVGALLFGIKDAPLSLSIVLHAGTLLATLMLFRSDLYALVIDFARGLRTPGEYLRSPSGRLAAAIVVATIPTAVIGLLLKESVEAWQSIPWIVGLCFLGSAAMVWTTRRGGGTGDGPTLAHALVIGLAQGIAVLPGLSRSGTTIAVAMMLGMTGAASFRFSFLLSLPAVAGAVVLELSKPGALASVGPAVWVGGLVATAVGVMSLVVLRRLVDQGRFWAFAIYLVPLGVGMIVGPWLMG